MKIVVLGAGQVGSSVAASLCNEANDITVIDRDPGALRYLQERLDLKTINGAASHPSVLEQAGARDADMILAVTGSDETNMVACQVAYTVFNTPTKIARVRNNEYLKNKKLFAQEAMPIDALISPEQLVTEDIARLISLPGALQVLDFAKGRVQMVAVKITRHNVLTGMKIKKFSTSLPRIDFRIVSIFRDGRVIIPDGDMKIEEGDEVFIIGDPKHIRMLLILTKQTDKSVNSIIIASGGNIGRRLAKLLEKKYRVKVIELSAEKARQASEELDDAIVLNGDAADEELLFEENADDADVFCALTNADEANIMSCMLAKRLGVSKVMALINRPSYVDLVQSDVIDIAISPQQATIGGLLAHVRRGDIAVVHSLRHGAAEAIETIAHGDRETSDVVDRRIEEIPLPPDTSIGAIVRDDNVLMAHDDIVIESGDHVILLVGDKRHLPEVERLFQVKVNFL